MPVDAIGAAIVVTVIRPVGAVIGPVWPVVITPAVMIVSVVVPAVVITVGAILAAIVVTVRALTRACVRTIVGPVILPLVAVTIIITAIRSLALRPVGSVIRSRIGPVLGIPVRSPAIRSARIGSPAIRAACIWTSRIWPSSIGSPAIRTARAILSLRTLGAVLLRSLLGLLAFITFTHSLFSELKIARLHGVRHKTQPHNQSQSRSGNRAQCHFCLALMPCGKAGGLSRGGERNFFRLNRLCRRQSELKLNGSVRNSPPEIDDRNECTRFLWHVNIAGNLVFDDDYLNT